VSTAVPRSVVPLADDDAIGLDLPIITDEYMKGRLSQSRDYTLLILSLERRRHSSGRTSIP
jgi:hypothetical protein